MNPEEVRAIVRAELKALGLLREAPPRQFAKDDPPTWERIETTTLRSTVRVDRRGNSETLLNEQGLSEANTARLVIRPDDVSNPHLRELIKQRAPYFPHALPADLWR